jgi:hypothetical protein
MARKFPRCAGIVISQTERVTPEKPSPHNLLSKQDADSIRRVGTIAQQETDQAREAARKQIKQSRDSIARADALLPRRWSIVRRRAARNLRERESVTCEQVTPQ